MLSPEAKVLPDEAALHEALAAEVARHPSQRAAADALGISAVYLGDVLHGRRPIGGMAARIGYAALTVYVPTEGARLSNTVVAQVVEGLRQAMGKGGAS